MGGLLIILYKYSIYLFKYFEYDFVGYNIVWEIKVNILVFFREVKMV